MNRRLLLLSLVTLPLALGGCLYGFAGGGLPRHIRTVAIIPFENQTPSVDLPRELGEALREGLEKRLGLRPATEDKADALVRGTITKFDIDIPVAVSADRQQATTARRRLAVGVDVTLIDQSTGAVLWERKGIVAEGEYAERTEAAGRKQAIERIVADVIEGALSQW
jgi:hypothetical protein